MSDASRQAHWENVYTTKDESQVSWFQEIPAPSLGLIELVGANLSSAIVDIGGGASRLVDSLISQGYKDVTVLDLSTAALASARTAAMASSCWRAASAWLSSIACACSSCRRCASA